MTEKPFQCCGMAGESPCRSFSESCLNPANYETEDDARLIANLKDWLASRSAKEGGELNFNRRTVQRLVDLIERRRPNGPSLLKTRNERAPENLNPRPTLGDLERETRKGTPASGHRGGKY